MPDMLVRLYALPPPPRELSGIVIRRPMPHEKTFLKSWIESSFYRGWADEFENCFKSFPITAFIATRDNQPIGFACYESTSRGFFGPTGVLLSERGRGIGTALLVRSLWGLQELGYAYAIIGGAGPQEFYEKTVGAVAIPDSVPGIYPPALALSAP